MMKLSQFNPSHSELDHGHVSCLVSTFRMAGFDLGDNAPGLPGSGAIFI
jgi:hypothetical protein